MNKAETLALFAQGKEAWNAWAADMLAERKALEEKGERAEAYPMNDAMRAWHDEAGADFSGHTFTEEADFSGFVFQGGAPLIFLFLLAEPFSDQVKRPRRRFQERLRAGATRQSPLQQCGDPLRRDVRPVLFVDDLRDLARPEYRNTVT